VINKRTLWIAYICKVRKTREMIEMKRMLLVGMLVVSGLSFGRDYEYNEKRDIVKPVQEQQERLNRYSSLDWEMDKEVTENNLETYSEFHRDLERMDRGHDKR